MSVTYSVDQDGHLLEDTRDYAVERHHPVARHQEASVDIEIATLIAVDLSAERFHDLRLIEPFADPSKLGVAQRA